MSETKEDQKGQSVECPRCGGTGEEPGAPIDLECGEAKCSRCQGMGQVEVKHTPGPWVLDEGRV